MASTPSQSTPQTLEERITNRDSEDSEDSEDQDDHEYIEDSDDSDDNEDNEVQLQPTRPESDFNPAPRDVFIAQYILEGLRLQALPHLPPELSLRILSLAGYEPRIVRHRKATMRYTANDFLQPGGDYSVAALYLTTPPLPRSCRRAAWATIQMRSADQGWASFGGDGTYVNSHTWFEVSILRPLAGGTSLVEGPEHLESTLGQTFCIPEDAGETLQGQGWQMVDSNGRVTWLAHHNITAHAEWRNYRVDWVINEHIEPQVPPAMGDGEGFVDALRPGDKIALWARATQLNWVNKVAEAILEIGYV